MDGAQAQEQNNEGIGIVIGAVVGTVAVSLANFLLHLAFDRQLFNDGLYFIIYLLFMPQGAWLGAFTGYGLVAVRRGSHRRAAVTLFVGGALLVAAALLFAFSYPADHWNYFVAYFGVAVVWAVGLIVWAVGLIVWAVALTRVSPSTT